MDSAAFADGIIEVVVQCGVVSDYVYAGFCSIFGKFGLRPHPDDVIHGKLCAKDDVFTRFNVYYTCKPRQVKSEEI